jgi:hypothetical protein
MKIGDRRQHSAYHEPLEQWQGEVVTYVGWQQTRPTSMQCTVSSYNNLMCFFIRLYTDALSTAKVMQLKMK